MAASLRVLARATALTLAFDAPAAAGDGTPPHHPLLDSVNAGYSLALSSQVAALVRDDQARLAVRSFDVKALTPALRANAERPMRVIDPKAPVNGELVISAVVPQQTLYGTHPIHVCVEGPARDEKGTVIKAADGLPLNTSQFYGMFTISPQGQVQPETYSGTINTASKAFAFACSEPLRDARDKLLASDAAQPR